MQRLDVRTIYLTASERKAGMIFTALAARYRSVVVAYEHGRRYTFRYSDDGVETSRSFAIPRVPRYCQLAYQWTRVFLAIVSQARRRPFDVCVSEGIQFTLVAPLLRKGGAVRRLVYYAQDWFPGRAFMQDLDLRCARWSDETWDISPRIGEARRARWGGAAPESTFLEPLYKPCEPYRRARPAGMPACCYVGGIREGCGLDIVVDAIALLRQKGVDIGLDVMGKAITARAEADLKLRIAERGVGDRVRLLGFVPEDEMFRLLSQAVCGCALFTGGLDNYSNWGIVGKVREYLESGVPVLISAVNPSAREIVERRAGMAAGDDAGEVAAALEFIADDWKNVEERSANAYRLACEKSSPDRLYAAIECGKGSDTTK